MIAVTASGNSYAQVQGSTATAVAGNAVTMSVWMYDSSPDNREITGYTLAFDLDTVGVGFSSNFLSQSLGPNVNDPAYVVTPNAGSGLTSAFSAQMPVTSVTPLNFDLSVSTSANPSKKITGTPFKLFDVTFSTNVSTTPGVFGFSFRADAQEDGFAGPTDYNVINFSVGNTAVSALGIGQFQITPVPEPSSLALVGLISVGMCLARRRRASV